MLKRTRSIEIVIGAVNIDAEINIGYTCTMKRLFISSAIALGLLHFAFPLYAQSVKTITLNDGSVIQGKIIALEQGLYTIETSHLGQIKVQDKDIQSITSTPITPAPETALNAPFKQQAEQVQGQILTDPSLMQDISGILENKEIMSILSDQKFLDDVLSQDPQRLEKNEKLDQLIENPQMKALLEKVNQKISTTAPKK